MRFILDTNALSEVTKPLPDPGFDAWWRDVPQRDLFVSVLSVGELARGIENLGRGRRRDQLQSLNQQLRGSFADRVLPVTEEIAVRWGEISGVQRRRGRAVKVIDGLIGATALLHDMTVVTRDVWDFDPIDCRLLNPWTG